MLCYRFVFDRKVERFSTFGQKPKAPRFQGPLDISRISKCVDLKAAVMLESVPVSVEQISTHPDTRARESPANEQKMVQPCIDEWLSSVEESE